MSYQVLARKWRPKTFTEMVGQAHVLKALVNALDDDRLHHAYLFTGTRGVGKTSIARLFAKSLNCLEGVSSQPCGQCAACVEIAEGRFVDLIEVDAASRTKVEDTRELLENVQYAPTHGRYKVYLIDEVHMLSTHSFNALLKTLEEPPPHVKFLLATTDPQKLPVTILSRCLQFNLKNMIPQKIVEHLQHVLGAEQIRYEEPALWLLARSADGSMRDAMSLTDQAIAFGAGEINESDVRAMLGTIDQQLVYRMLEQLANKEIATLLQTVEELAQFSPDYDTVLGDLISLLHRIAVAQAIPEAVDNSLGDQQQVEQLAGLLSAEDVQLYYQIALLGRKDLPWVPDAREGLEMVLLRMAAFRPASAAPSAQSQALAEGVTSSNVTVSQAVASAEPAVSVAAVTAAPVETPAPLERSAPIEKLTPPPTVLADDPPPWDDDSATVLDEGSPDMEPVAAKKPEPVAVTPAAPVAATPERPASSMHTQEPMMPPQPPPMMETPIPMAADFPAPPMAEPSFIDVPDYSGCAAPSPAVTEGGAQHNAPAGQSPSAANTVGLEDGHALPAAAIYNDPGKTHALASPAAPKELSALQPGHWVAVRSQLGLTGMTESLAGSLSLEVIEAGLLRFHYTQAQRAVLTDVHRQRIAGALEHYFNASLEVEFAEKSQTQETPYEYQQRNKALRLAKAVDDLRNDPIVQKLMGQFEGRLVLDSIIPIDPTH